MTQRITGWTGSLLRVDLSTGEHSFEPTPERARLETIGGRGLAGHFLRQASPRAWDDPESPLLLFTGPLVATASPTSGHLAVAARSPLTGTVTDASVGGQLATEIKRAGLDGIILTGRSETLAGLEIDDDSVRLVDATGLAGMEAAPVFDRLGGRSGAVAGPAAETGCLFASITVDRNFSAAAGGLGAVMAAKGLKYLAVRGRREPAVADPAALAAARDAVLRLIDAAPALRGELGIARFGTGAFYDLIASRRMLPTANFRRTHFPPAGTMNAHAMERAWGPVSAGCAGCPIQCKRRRDDGSCLPEFETLAHFSALLENENLSAVVAAHDRCRELGLDPVSAAATLACLAELEGAPIPPDRILALLDDVALARGLGKDLAAGSYRFAAARGRPELSMSVKKQELPAYDPRGAYGMALAYATSTRGACHLRAYPISHEILRKPVATDRFTFSGKARIIKIAEDANAAVDSLTACKFAFVAAGLEEYAKVYSAVTGIETSAHDLLAAGERIDYNERLINAANGFTSADDDLPARFFSEPGSGGDGIRVPPIDRDDFLAARANYYKIRGLDRAGKPTREKAAALNLPWTD